jgi:hypothetical protein
MKTIEVKVFTFDELSEAAKEKAREWYRNGALDYDWWLFTYDDAKYIGLKLTGFDLDRNRHATGQFIFEAKDVIEAILSNHGETCETYKTAENFKSQLFPLLEKESELEYRDYDLEGEISDLEDEFLNSLLEDYSIILQNEYEYLMSDEAVNETILANEYEFLEDGTRY